MTAPEVGGNPKALRLPAFDRRSGEDRREEVRRSGDDPGSTDQYQAGFAAGAEAATAAQVNLDHGALADSIRRGLCEIENAYREEARRIIEMAIQKLAPDLTRRSFQDVLARMAVEQDGDSPVTIRACPDLCRELSEFDVGAAVIIPDESLNATEVAFEIGEGGLVHDAAGWIETLKAALDADCATTNGAEQ